MQFDFKLNPFWEIKEKRYCFDIEANGLLKEVNLFFCAVIENVDNGDILYYAPDNAQEFLDELSKAKWLIGHNIIGYDLPALKKLYGWQPSPDTILYDTVIAARLYDPNFPMHPDCPKRVPNAHATKAKQDQEREALKLAGKLNMAEIEMKVAKIEVMKNVGPHTLMNLGYHVGCHKGDFGEEMTFEEYCPEMMVYCAQDVTVNVKVFHMLEKKLRAWSTQSIACEMEAASYISYQMRSGWFFDIDSAGELQSDLERIKEEIENEVRERFKPIPVPHSLDEDKQPAVSFPRVTSSGKLSSVGLKSFFGEGFEELFCIPTFVKTPGSITYTSGHFTKIKWKEFNLGSRPQIAERLQRLGITLTKFTAKGNPIIDDGVLNKLHDKHPDVPELLLLKRYFKVNKILSMVNGWMDAYDWDTGRIHGFVNSVGAVTNRMTHSAPNVAQTPSAKTTKIQGAIDPITGFPVYAEKLEGKDLLLICSETSDEYDEGAVVKYSTKHKKILGYAFTKEAVRPQHDFITGISGKELLWGEEGAWGADCRNLFTVPDGYTLVGSDASGLELRCLAHYMNDDKYTDLILNGDIHTYNQKMAGLAERGQAKTFRI